MRRRHRGTDPDDGRRRHDDTDDELSHGSPSLTWSAGTTSGRDTSTGSSSPALRLSRDEAVLTDLAVVARSGLEARMRISLLPGNALLVARTGLVGRRRRRGTDDEAGAQDDPEDRFT